MSAYPFAGITLNNRDVSLNEILTESPAPQSAFEEHCFEFIRRWFSGAEEFILHTSGSTGPPKPILIKRSQMTASATATATALGLRTGDVALICLDPAYIAGQMMFVRCFTTGMRIIATDPTSNPLNNVPTQITIDFTAVVPLQLIRMLQSPQRQRLNDVGKIIVGGAAVDTETIHALQNLRCSVFATYGMTETISHIALQLLNGPGPSEVFTALPGVSLHTDERGCLTIEVPYLEHSVTTNDLVHLSGGNQFRWIGRIDNVINTGGVKVSPERIEHKLESLKSTLFLHDRLVITSRTHPDFGEEVVLVVERRTPGNELISRLKAILPTVLDRYEIPKEIFFHFPFPETKTGKIDRTALKNAINSQH